ncbi:hypothetical protein NMY22_g19676 [Coprinellus aureogranulatus]|nr:hypothetical protein NMY22_g19676 [Coprinellus aureogranulatus]
MNPSLLYMLEDGVDVSEWSREMEVSQEHVWSGSFKQPTWDAHEAEDLCLSPLRYEDDREEIEEEILVNPPDLDQAPRYNTGEHIGFKRLYPSPSSDPASSTPTLLRCRRERPPAHTMHPAQRNKVDISKLNPQEQQLFAKYGKLPTHKNVLMKMQKERKYFDSGDYALSKAGKADQSTVGTAIPNPENIPHASTPTGNGHGNGHPPLSISPTNSAQPRASEESSLATDENTTPPVDDVEMAVDSETTTTTEAQGQTHPQAQRRVPPPIPEMRAMQSQTSITGSTSAIDGGVVPTRNIMKVTHRSPSRGSSTGGISAAPAPSSMSMYASSSDLRSTSPTLVSGVNPYRPHSVASGETSLIQASPTTTDFPLYRHGVAAGGSGTTGMEMVQEESRAADPFADTNRAPSPSVGHDREEGSSSGARVHEAGGGVIRFDDGKVRLSPD